LADFTVPKWLEDDVYELDPEIRRIFPYPCHRFIIIGGRRTGAVLHQDPKASGAWNCCLVGRKRWCLFPPEVPPELLSPGQDSEQEAYLTKTPAYWWLDTYPQLRAKGEGLGMVECVQGPGEMIYVPPGWWHAVLNVPMEDESICVCCTQNSLTRAMLRGTGGQPLTAEGNSWSWQTLKTRWPRLAGRIHGYLTSELAGEGIAPVTEEEMRKGEEGDLAAEEEGPEAAGGRGEEAPAEQVSPAWKAVMEERQASVEARGVGLASGKGGDAPWVLETVEATALSLKACREGFIRRNRMVVVTGMDKACTPLPEGHTAWSYLDELFGAKTVAVHRGASQGGPDFRGGDRMELMPLGELIGRIQAGQAKGMYLYDCPLPDKLPQLLEVWRLPRYFSHCYLQQTMLSHPNKTSWPTLFIGGAGTGSPTHIDRWQGHFWMLQITGTKRWTVWHPDDLPLLSPSWASGKYDPSFPSAAEIAALPGASSARKVELQPVQPPIITIYGHITLDSTPTGRTRAPTRSAPLCSRRCPSRRGEPDGLDRDRGKFRGREQL